MKLPVPKYVRCSRAHILAQYVWCLVAKQGAAMMHIAHSWKKGAWRRKVEMEIFCSCKQRSALNQPNQPKRWYSWALLRTLASLRTATRDAPSQGSPGDNSLLERK
jgi:hypothetical protein